MFPYFLVFRRVGEYNSHDLFYQFCLPHQQLSLIPQKNNVFFYVHEMTQVVILYTSLRLVEGVYKPQHACVGEPVRQNRVSKRACESNVPVLTKSPPTSLKRSKQR